MHKTLHIVLVFFLIFILGLLLSFLSIKDSMEKDCLELERSVPIGVLIS